MTKQSQLQTSEWVHPIGEDLNKEFNIFISITGTDLTIPKRAEEITAEFVLKLKEVLNGK